MQFISFCKCFLYCRWTETVMECASANLWQHENDHILIFSITWQQIIHKADFLLAHSPHQSVSVLEWFTKLDLCLITPSGSLVSIQSVDCRNSMPTSIISAPTLTVFWNRLKTYLFSQSFSSCFRFLHCEA